MTAVAATRPGAERRQHAARLDGPLLRAAFVLVLGPVLALLDTTIVGVGIAAVSRDLHGSLTTVQWVSAGYLLALSMVMPLSGWAAERFGARRMWIGSVALFTLGSALCGLAWSMPALIAFRVVQGIGGGMIQPIGQATLVRAAGPERLGRVLSLTLLPLTFAPVLGPVLGGVLLRHLDWRWMFLVNVPIGILTAVLAARFLPRDERGPGRTRLDVLGLALLSPGLAALVYGLSESSWLAMGAGVALVGGYAVHALRTSRTPLIDLRLFARRGFAVASGNSFLQGATLYSSMLLLPLYFQSARHAGVLEAGLLLTPQALGTAAASFLSGRLADRVAPRPLILLGIALTLAGTVPFVLAGPPTWLLMAALTLRGVGLGIAMTPGMRAIYASVPRDQVQRAAGAVNTVNRVGGSLGTAVLALVLQDALAHHPASDAFSGAFGWALALSALTLVPAALYPSKRT
ncbi:DHA2 family efflux MFS transporter permease subunit [Actinomadura rupiterrae]|uniref:DHA2 family efflux MFS transporter permease subunit n=1 Tax=Actinomadura rupiterrae TaxID=559627 RepID=UPI0020A5002B|nr:DHA2 family efflux MFS transporter permease subunit [Actinomadura rupiterrae]MCP2340233.1 EmrB/QacA subfamily drug resistance transporter [Actinomadura rupiterrae]